jgi:hypothetical protein
MLAQHLHQRRQLGVAAAAAHDGLQGLPKLREEGAWEARMKGWRTTRAHTAQHLPVLQLSAAAPDSTADGMSPQQQQGQPKMGAGGAGITTLISANTRALSTALTWQKMLLLTMPRMYPSLHLLFR